MGAGPAGLSVAIGLLDSGLSVLVLEAGQGSAAGVSILPRVALDAQNPYPDGDIDESHAAGVGGTAGLWSFNMIAPGEAEPVPGGGCRYAPLDPLDFRPRPDIGTPGWDVDPAELAPWYEAAQRVAGLGPYRYDVAAWTSADGPQPLALGGSGVMTTMFQFGPASAWTVHARARLEAAENVDLVTGQNVVRLHRSQAGAVAGVVVSDGHGGTGIIAARVVVLAAGGLETVRILLDTARHDGQPAPGDRSGLVGRYFMEHPLVRGGLLVTDPDRHLLDELGLYGTRNVGGTYVSARMSLDAPTVTRECLLATSMLLVPRDRSFAARGSRALARLRSPSGRRDPMTAKIRNGLTVLGGGFQVARAMLASRHQPNIDRADWARPDSDRRWTAFDVIHQTEQSPEIANRLHLGDEIDALGRSTLRLDWRWTLADQHKVARARDFYGAALGDAGIGKLIGTDYDGGSPRLLGGTHHHMGVTRLAADPDSGVVDPQCRIHDTDAVYIAGSAVFPSSGYVNPTLTVVALALRLAAHLTTTYGSGRPPVPRTTAPPPSN